jgi:2-polyprenyl-3-methyl-5-hydroxy-6-metoxy-1,4-benzoquinol methylase
MKVDGLKLEPIHFTCRIGSVFVSWIEPTLNALLKPFGYELDLHRTDDPRFRCPNLPVPSQEIIRQAQVYFSNSFPISPQCHLTPTEIDQKIGSYFWHYPFEFGGRLVNSDHQSFKGIQGRHYRRYLHIFPAVLSLTGGALTGKTVLDIACNAGFWSIQARLAGAEAVLGVEASPRNVEQANFILDLTGLDRIHYRALNAYDVSSQALGQFDIAFFFGLLYHLDDPMLALGRLHEVTKSFAVVDTSTARSPVPTLSLKADTVHDQNFSNELKLVPSKSAVPLMLRHVGFREVLEVPDFTRNPDYSPAGGRRTFIAYK